MQVVLAALGQDAWVTFVRASWGFSVAVIIFVAGLAASFMFGIIGLLVAQAQFALRTRYREKVMKDRSSSA